jgi:hypothetical protein
VSRLRPVESSSPPLPGRPILQLSPGGCSLLDELGPVLGPTVALTVARHIATPELGAAARRTLGLELLVDPETWRNQQPPSARPAAFGRCGYALGSAFDADRHRLSSHDERTYLRAVLEAQVAAHATRLIAPYHRSGGPASASRSLDLRLAERAVDLLPQLDGGVGRRLYVGLAVTPRLLRTPLDRAWLASRYGSLEASGLYVTFPGPTERRARIDIEAAAELLAALREVGAGEILVAATSGLALPFVASGLADAAVLTTGGVYHAESLRSVLPEASNAARRRAEALFSCTPCSCGHHRADLPPACGDGRTLHTATQLAAAFTAVDDRTETSDDSYVRRLARADGVARQAGYAPISPAGLAVLAVARRARRRRARAQLM